MNFTTTIKISNGERINKRTRKINSRPRFVTPPKSDYKQSMFIMLNKF
jgi:hypothetical protein